jgi:hypothetical protein
MWRSGPFVLLTAILSLMTPARAALGVACSGTVSMNQLSSCEQTDKYFSNFGYYQNSGSVPAENQINLAFSGASAAGPITQAFSSDQWISSTLGSDVFLSNEVTVDQSVNPGYVLTGFDLVPGSIGIPEGSSQSLQVITNFCTNSLVACSSHSDPGYGEFNYSASSSGSLMEYCYNGTPAIACTGGASVGPMSITIDPSLNITSIFIDTRVLIDSGTDKLTLNGFQYDFFEGQESAATAPEPGTLLLTGAVLAAAILKRRRTTLLALPLRQLK